MKYKSLKIAYLRRQVWPSMSYLWVRVPTSLQLIFHGWFIEMGKRLFQISLVKKWTMHRWCLDTWRRPLTTSAHLTAAAPVLLLLACAKLLPPMARALRQRWLLGLLLKWKLLPPIGGQNTYRVLQSVQSNLICQKYSSSGKLRLVTLYKKWSKLDRMDKIGQIG